MDVAEVQDHLTLTVSLCSPVVHQQHGGVVSFQPLSTAAVSCDAAGVRHPERVL